MLSADDNERLTRTGPGTPMGELFRRFWVPVLLARELPGAGLPAGAGDGAGRGAPRLPRHARTASVSSSPRCPHRGADLFFGRNEECGLRCVYHGWKFDVDGRCVDIPTMAHDEGLRGRVGLTAYPARGARRPGLGLPGAARAPARAPGARVRPRAARPIASSPRSCSSATGRRRARARSTPPTSRSCTRRWVAGRARPAPRPPAGRRRAVDEGRPGAGVPRDRPRRRSPARPRRARPTATTCTGA